MGWKQVAGSFKPRLNKVSNYFSINQLSKTLFAPWRRIIIYPGASMAERLRAFGDNLFSRSVGFVVRILVILVSLIVSLIVLILTSLELVLWPLLPPAIIVLLVLGAVT